MNIALVMIPDKTEAAEQQRLFFPLAIYLLANYAREAGHQVTVVDSTQNTYSDMNYLSGFDLVGFSCNSFNFADSCEVAEKIKAINSDLKVLMGGIHPTYYSEEALQKPYIDYVIRGEGELALVSLLNSNFRESLLANIPGLSYKIDNNIIHNKKGEAIALDENTLLPAYDLVARNTKYLSFETSRGCQNKCTFCSVDHSYKWRPFSVKVVLDRLEKSLSMIKDVNAVKSILTTDDCFTTDIERAILICKEITRLFPDITFRIEARIRDLLSSDELLDTLAESNVSLIQVGVECGYDEGLKRIRKGINVEQIRRCAEKLGRKGLGRKTFFSFIVGMPWEHKKECLDTIDFANDIFNEYRVPGNIALWAALPSVLSNEFGMCKDELYMQKGWWYDKELFFKLHPNLSPEEFDEILIKRQNFLDIASKYIIL